MNPARFAFIPSWIDPLRAIAVALFDSNGDVIEANEGYRFTLASEAGEGVKQRLAEPPLGQLVKMQPDETGLLYTGLITLNIGHGLTRAFAGSIFRRNQLFMLVAELDISAFESLSSENERLNQELEENRKLLSKRNHSLQKLQEAIEAHKRNDGLTGLANLKLLDLRVSEEIQRWERYRRPLALLLMDMDNFSQINDEFGREVGDELLQHVATILNGATRTLDLVARYGGQEFAILLPETNEMGAMIVAERLRMDLEDQLILPLLRPLTASFGVALLQPDEKREAFYARAGRAVKFSKAHGKSCITIAGVVAECDHIYQGAAQETDTHV
ncbi:MAG: GGDEF domain-containing protein [Sulfurimicrobium sp.]|nr:GGDEF domain-containing protein [Sulfurimicrobium sp.]MDP1897226.1 GGDEF domain-containing protein [Sulfurimicrobium sp.]